MRIHSVEAAGFGPFRARQTIDLDRYAADGLFLITGRTGTGKSSILDAVCFALYGKTPRSEDGERRLRSDHAELGEPTEVALEFSIDAVRWRIVRSPEYERPKQRGEGTTTEAARVEMSEWVDDAWVGRAARAVDVGTLVDEVVGLSAQQFLQVILLAQGRFAHFLLAKNDERQRLLRTLFGTRRFEDYEGALDARRRDAEARVGSRRQALEAALEQAAGDVERALGGPAGEADEPIERLGAAVDAARSAHEAALAREADARSARETAERARDAVRAMRDHQVRRDAARAVVAELDASADRESGLRAELEAARRAEAVRGPADAARVAVDAESEAAGAESRARDAWSASRSDDDPADAAPPAELDAYVAEAQRRTGAWEELRDRETRLAARDDALSSLRDELAGLEGRAARVAEQRAALPERIDQARQALAQAAARAAHRERVEEHIAALDQQFRALQDAARRSAAYAAASASAAEAVSARRSAEEAVDHLHARRLLGIAGELAASLEPGAACAVCGSLEHPAPAAPSDDAVTPEAIDDAEARRAAAAAAADAASTARQAAEVALREAEARAGGRTEVEVEGDLIAARDELADAQSAAAEKAALERQLGEHERAQRRLADEADAVTAERAALAARIAADEQQLAADRRAVDAARGPFGSVAERIGSTRRLASRAAALAEAVREYERAAATAAGARADLADALGAAGFGDDVAARDALRGDDARGRIERELSERGARRLAAEAELAGLPPELPADPVDTAPAEAAVAGARAAVDAAVEDRTASGRAADALAEAWTRAETVRAEIAEAAGRAQLVTRLADTVAGRPPNAQRMNLETFVLAAELEEIVEAANVRLAEVSDGRYTLRHTDALARRGAASGLGIEVVDAFTGRARPPHSLSGGETFLASLALALGLAEVVTGRAGGVRLDTLFVDEGFGSLDADTLESAMRTLDALRQGGRTVGVISHVEAMREQIPAQLRVRRVREGWSVVDQD
ncbi:AAA family ATPase [Microbacterium indicum]|uniref:AAA family ATPase n=1 Tax=Microbacterium indicum TaxID=358100 RepID=UPI0003F92752|nr:SMC family ATPase [Microbacterium indicum]